MDKQEPVALKMYRGELCYLSQHDDQSFGMWCPITQDYLPFAEDEKFYTAPPKREWVELTDIEIDDIKQNAPVYISAKAVSVIVPLVEAKLKEKNT